MKMKVGGQRAGGKECKGGSVARGRRLGFEGYEVLDWGCKGEEQGFTRPEGSMG